MDHNPPIPSSSKTPDDHLSRRPSIFDNNDIEEKFVKSPKENAFCYPTDYVEKVTTEIESWKAEISKTLEEKKEYKNKILELENTIVGENILSPEQQDVIQSFGFDEYTRRAKEFCDQAVIIAQICKIKNKERFSIHEANQRKLQALLKRYDDTS